MSLTLWRRLIRRTRERAEERRAIAEASLRIAAQCRRQADALMAAAQRGGPERWQQMIAANALEARAQAWIARAGGDAAEAQRLDEDADWWAARAQVTPAAAVVEAGR